MATRKVRINTGSATPLEIPEQAGKLHVKTSAGVVPVTKLWAKDVDSTVKLIWEPVTVDVPTQIDTQNTIDTGPCSGAVCPNTALVEYPKIPGPAAGGQRWNCSIWSNTGNCKKGNLVDTFSWCWHQGNLLQEVAKIYEVDGTITPETKDFGYTPPPPGHIILDYGTHNISSRITVFLKSHLAGVIDGAANLLPIIMTTGSGIHTDCNGSMPRFNAGAAGTAFNGSNGANSAIPYVYICNLGDGAQSLFGCTPHSCSNPVTETDPVTQIDVLVSGPADPNQSICECDGGQECISDCCPAGGGYPCGGFLVQDCGGPVIYQCGSGGGGSGGITTLIDQGRIIPLIDTECLRTDTECSTICYSVPAVKDPVLYGTTGSPPLLECRSVCRVPNVVYTASNLGGNDETPLEKITPTCMYNSGHKFSDFGMVMKGGCNCADCPQEELTCATQGCSSQYSLRIIMPFYFNFPNTRFDATGGIDLLGRIIDITFSGMFRAYPGIEAGSCATWPDCPGQSAGGNSGYIPGNSSRTLPPILSGIRDLLIGRISSCCSVMAPAYKALTGVNADLIPTDGAPNIFWCMNEFPCQNGSIPSHTHQLVIELNLGSGQVCPQCLFSAPNSGTEYAYNIDAFQFYPITDRAGNILKPLDSFLSKRLTSDTVDSGVSGIKSLRFMAHATEGLSGLYGNLYSNKETTFNYTNRAEQDNAWEGVYLEVPESASGVSSLKSYIVSGPTTAATKTRPGSPAFEVNSLPGGTINNNILNQLLNVIQQPQYPISTRTDCKCEAVP